MCRCALIVVQPHNPLQDRIVEPFSLTLALARVDEDSVATLRVTSTIPTLPGGQRVSLKSSQYPVSITSEPICGAPVTAAAEGEVGVGSW